MKGKLSVVLRNGAALLCAGFFLVVGIHKLIHPAGTPPRILADIGIDYTLILRAVGALEAVIGALMLGRFRVLALLAAIVFIGATTMLVAVHSTDGAFLKNCGCMGGVNSESDAPASFEMLVLRNSGILIVLFSLLTFTQQRLRLMTMLAIGSSVLFPLIGSAFYLGERVRHHEAGRVVSLLKVGSVRSQTVGWKLPDLKCFPTTEGKVSRTATDLPALVKEGDQLIAYSVDCPYCEQETGDWIKLAQKLASRNRRLVLVCAATERERFERFQRNHQLGAIASVLLEDPYGLFQMGVTAVPAKLDIREGAMVVAAPSVKRSTPAHASLFSLPGGEARVAQFLAQAFAVGGQEGSRGGVNAVDAEMVRGPGFVMIGCERDRNFLVIAGSPAAADAYLELALWITPGETIAGAHVLAFESPHATLMTMQELEAALASKSLAEAEELMRATKKSTPMDAYVAQMVIAIVGRAKAAIELRRLTAHK